MMKEIQILMDESLLGDRELFSSLLKHVVQTPPNEDPTDFVLSSLGQNVGADRCYVYRFWDPGKTSMCTNTHEWCAEGVKSEIGGQQTCNLADLVEFNAHITSGRDFLFTDINAIDAGSREWLAPQGIKSLIATPMVGANNMVCGFVGFDFVKAPCKEFTDRIIFNIHEAASLLLNCLRLHEQDMAHLDIMRQEGERQEYDHDLDSALAALQNDVNSMRPAQMLEIVRKRLDADFCDIVKDIRPDGGGTILAGHALARNGMTNARDLVINPKTIRALDMRLLASSVVTFREGEIAWLGENTETEDFVAGLVGQMKVLHSTGVLQAGRVVGILCVGFAEERPLTPLQASFLRHSAFIIVSALERIATYHDLTVALNVANLKAEVVEFIFKHQDYREFKEFLGTKVCAITGAQHLMLYAENGSRSDWFGEDAPNCCRQCAKTSARIGKRLPQEFFAESEVLIFREGDPLPVMNQPSYCPMMSSAVAQFKNGNDWWRMVADYTKPHKHNMDMVAHGLRTALEFLAIAYDRECREKMIV